MYLSECYHGALLEKDWTAIGDAELVEYAEFLCSAANDAKRLRKVIAKLKIQLKLIQDDEDDELDNSAAMLVVVSVRFFIPLPFTVLYD
jgi:hypothetical protein